MMMEGFCTQAIQPRICSCTQSPTISGEMLLSLAQAFRIPARHYVLSDFGGFRLLSSVCIDMGTYIMIVKGR
jgi:hypothetical protein